ncbi:MAG TPA: glycoside hydrolase family 97 catalytic domain-containing protein [Candidatus Limnocylindria bacterium]|nr:glycoside hydrolase family 97 catalytic domain-containing protein [Candidatus Limnocylindria bacterium]
MGFAAIGHAKSQDWSLSSPDGKCVITVTLGATGDLSYQVRKSGTIALPSSPLGLHRDDQSFTDGLKLESAGPVEHRRERYDLFTGNKVRVDNRLNQRSLAFANTNKALLAMDLAATDEGVAFRYRFPETASEVRVLREELTGFAVPTGTRGWLQPYHAAGQYTPAYEDFYSHVAPGDAPSQLRGKPVGWAFPALFELGGGAGWALVTESGTDAAYCACHLGLNTGGGVYCMAFPAADEGTRGQLKVVGPEPRYTLPWTMPWRVIVLGKTAGDIAMSTLITDVASPSRVADASWVRPGRASWSWWSYPEGPNTAAVYNKFTDFASVMGWEYTLFDGGWWETSLKGISARGQSNKVASLAWSYAGDFYSADRRRKKLDELASGGVMGVKADFWCSDRQEALAAMNGLFEDAAARHMLVDLHGCTLPRGWQRTWPNFITAEAVVGTESYFYEAKFPEKAAELNTVLPFTRNAVGPMDYTPVACSPKKYARLTTASHELATALVFTSGLICYADKPEYFQSLPQEALAILRDAPARWEESRCLIGEPGKAAVFARRSGQSWFISGLNGTGDPLPIDLDLRPYRSFRHWRLIAEGADPKMEMAVTKVQPDSHWKHTLPPRGGFVLRLEK